MIQNFQHYSTDTYFNVITVPLVIFIGFLVLRWAVQDVKESVATKRPNDEN